MYNRYLLCLLICCALLYFAVPRINPYGTGWEGLFAISWLAFAFLVFAGNLAALLFPNQWRRKGTKQALPEKTKRRMRAN
ncbi:hypothetical protein ACFSCZ_17650 [Siminovitchia sediminis]|uniref:Uncharacterized protein n=1 Tax=Siminovitchia sediminis TaxID=1274353 RepID=A0ABW4KN10_9BACI